MRVVIRVLGLGSRVYFTLGLMEVSIHRGPVISGDPNPVNPQLYVTLYTPKKTIIETLNP